MKTNQVMKREHGFMQRTKDSYFNANALINYYNEHNKQKKILSNYRKNESTNEFIEQLKLEGIEKPIITGRGKGEKSGTWMHPKLFIDFAMWVSVEFKSKVIDYVLDGLIKTRNNAGDYYNEMTLAIMEAHLKYYGTKPNPMLYIVEANRIRNLATDKRDRNEMTEDELRQITYLQKVNANLLLKGIGKTARLKRLQEAAEIKV